jgi:hypothetical protein
LTSRRAAELETGKVDFQRRYATIDSLSCGQDEDDWRIVDGISHDALLCYLQT